MCFYLWPLAANTILLFYAAAKFQKLEHPLVIGGIVFYACWSILLLFLSYKVFKANKKQKNKIIWLNY